MLHTISFPRLQKDLETLGSIGRQADYGLYRMAFSDGDMEGRQWLMRRIEESALQLYVDEAANVHGRLDWDGATPAVMAGSHIDTIPGAGALDGALGVVVGLECLRRIKELGIDLKHPLEVVAFTDEEGRFGGSIFLQAAISPFLVVGALIFSFVVGGISGIAPALQASRLKPEDALRYE